MTWFVQWLGLRPNHGQGKSLAALGALAVDTHMFLWLLCEINFPNCNFLSFNVWTTLSCDIPEAV